jgi:hypothetical protein
MTANMQGMFDNLNTQAKADFMKEQGYTLKKEGKISSSTNLKNMLTDTGKISSSSLNASFFVFRNIFYIIYKNDYYQI